MLICQIYYISLYRYFLGYVAKVKESSDEVDAETYGLASSSKNTAKIPKTRRKKSGKVRVRSDSEDEPVIKRKKSSRQTQREKQKKSGRQKVLLDSEDEPATERKKSRWQARLDTENEHEIEQKKSSSQLLGSDVKSNNSKWYDKLDDMNTDLKEALRVGEILTIFVYFL